MIDSSSTQNIFFVYPGQPFIGEGVMNTILSFNNLPREDNNSSVLEKEKALLAFGLIMMALESLVKTKLHEINVEEPKKLNELFLVTLPQHNANQPAINLWRELKIVRNQITHAGLFESSEVGGAISKATLAKLNSMYNTKLIDLSKEKTRKWGLSINPLSIARYESLVALLFFYWYGKETEVWRNNNPLNSLYVDCRLKHDITGNWINEGRFNHLTNRDGDFSNLLGFLYGRLNSKNKQKLLKLTRSVLKIDLESKLDFANTILKMFEGSPGLSS